MISGRDELKRMVRAAVRKTAVRDTYTRFTARTLLSSEAHGIDALLTAPELIREAQPYGDIRLKSQNREERADAVFATLFIDRSPISAQTQAVLWSLKKLGMDAGTRELSRLRKLYEERTPEERLQDALDISNLASLAVSVDLFDEETPSPSLLDERLSASLRVDALADAGAAWPSLSARGCRGIEDVRAYLASEAQRLCAGSFLVTKAFAGGLWEGAVLPAARDLGIPVVEAETAPVALPDPASLGAMLDKEGWTFRPYASGATAIEQLPGLWEGARKAIAQALADAYAPLLKNGWLPSAGEIAHDIEQWLG